MNIYFILMLVVIVAIFLIYSLKENSNYTKEEAICIGKNSQLYEKLGCHYCEIQEEDFGKNYKYLNVIDCFYEIEKCDAVGITGTPTWIINETMHKGYKNSQELKEITGCLIE